MPDPREESRDDNAWSFIFSTIFLVLTGAGIYHLSLRNTDFMDVSVFAFIIMALAAFRLTRLVVYDSIAWWFRDLFFDKEKRSQKNGLFTVIRTKPMKGFRRKMVELICCPWCVGVWISLAVVYFYYLTPLSWPVLIILAVAGVSSFVQISANLLGWHAEGKKIDVQKKQ